MTPNFKKIIVSFKFNPHKDMVTQSTAKFSNSCYYASCCRDGVIGSHARLKILWEQSRAGSSPAPGTM